MTSISATSASTYQSPLQLLQSELQSEVSTGAVSSTDQTALSSALNSASSPVLTRIPPPPVVGLALRHAQQQAMRWVHDRTGNPRGQF